MEIRQYYDWTSERDLDEADGTPFSEWIADPNHPACFAVHPEGFPVFLRSDDLRELDEYSRGDPYQVADRITSSFHKNRICTTLELLRHAIPDDFDAPTILDVACGEGHISAAIQQRFLRAELSAFDASLSAISRASHAYPGIAFSVANAYEPPYRPDYFDCVVCNNIWEHVPDPLRLLERVARSLKIGGALIISTPSRYRLNNLLGAILGRSVVFASAHHVTEYSVGQVLEQVRWGGFSMQKISGKLVMPEHLRVKNIITHFVVAPILHSVIRLTGSHHVLGHTAFYLAKKERANPNSE